MEEITVEKIKLINTLCLKSGENSVVISYDRLLSALGNQYQPYDCGEKIIASLYKSLIIDHAFENGNKRTAVIVMAYLLSTINKTININDEELCALTYKIADKGGSNIEVDYLADKLCNHINEDLMTQTLESFVRNFCDKHKWLIDKLAE